MAVLAGLFLVACLMSLFLTQRDVAAMMLFAAVMFGVIPSMGSAYGPPPGFSFAEPPGPLPAVSFTAANGKRLSLKDFRGQVVLLVVWTAACEACRPAMESLDRLQANHRADGFEVLAVTADGLVDARRYLRTSAIHALDVYVDNDRATHKALGTAPLPFSILIDRDGNVVGRISGVVQWDSPEALALVRRYLDG